MSPSTAGERLGKTAKEGQELMDNFFKSFPKVKELIESSQKFLKENGYVEDWIGRRRRLPDYFLPPYEARYKDEKAMEEQTFNPILGCKNRSIQDSWINYYIEQAAKCKNNKQFDDLAKKAFMGDVDPKTKKPKHAPIVLISNNSKIAQAERQCLNARIQGGAASLTKLAMVNVFNDELLRKWRAKLIITVHDEVLVECPEYYADLVEERLPKVMIDTAKPYINVPMSCDPYNVTRWYCDEAAVSIQEEFKKIEKEGFNREEALNKVYENHLELPPEAIKNTIENGADLEW